MEDINSYIICFLKGEVAFSITEEMFVLPSSMFSETPGYHVGHRMLNYIKIPKKGLCLVLHHYMLIFRFQ